MEVTEIRIKLASVADRARGVLAFCTMEFDNEFVVNDVKIVDGRNGPFVSFPGRKVVNRCLACKGPLTSSLRRCDRCGESLFVDVVYPKTAACRARLHAAVMVVYQNALDARKT